MIGQALPDQNQAAARLVRNSVHEKSKINLDRIFPHYVFVSKRPRPLGHPFSCCASLLNTANTSA